MQRFRSFDDTEIAYIDVGSGPAVLLLHGFAADHNLNWVQPGVVDALVDHEYRVIAADARGHGASEKPADPARYAGDAMVDDARALLDHLSITDIQVVGYSMGSMVALRLVPREPRAGSLILGGIGADAATEAAYRGGRFTLGDMGYLDDDGYLFLNDRSADLIISGGVNIATAEVDAVLLSHPAVGDAATIGVPNQEWGEEVLAVVQVAPPLQASPALAGELLRFCREHLAAFKCPRRVEFVDTLPRQDNGKIYRRVLRDQYRARDASTR